MESWQEGPAHIESCCCPAAVDELLQRHAGVVVSRHRRASLSSLTWLHVELSSLCGIKKDDSHLSVASPASNSVPTTPSVPCYMLVLPSYINDV